MDHIFGHAHFDDVFREHSKSAGTAFMVQAQTALSHCTGPDRRAGCLASAATGARGTPNLATTSAANWNAIWRRQAQRENGKVAQNSAFRLTLRRAAG